MEPTSPQPEHAPGPVNPAEGLPTPDSGEAVASPPASPSQTPVATPTSAPEPAVSLDPASGPVVASPAAVSPAGSTPTVAADVDVIEKEWVDKADEIIKKTAGDPHAEEEAVEALQVDYLKKRYGKDVAASQDE